MEAKVYDLTQARRDRALTGKVQPKEVTDIQRMRNSHEWGERITMINRPILDALIGSYDNHANYVRHQDNEFYMCMDHMEFYYVEIMACKTTGTLFKFQFMFLVDAQTAVMKLGRVDNFRLESGEWQNIGCSLFPC